MRMPFGCRCAYARVCACEREERHTVLVGWPGKLSAYVVRDASAAMTEPSQVPTGDCSPTSASQTRAVIVEVLAASAALAAKEARSKEVRDNILTKFLRGFRASRVGRGAF